MMPEIYLTYVDMTESGDRENWSVFYVRPIVTTSAIAARNAGKKEIARLCAEDPDLMPSHFHAHIVGPLEIQ